MSREYPTPWKFMDRHGQHLLQRAWCPADPLVSSWSPPFSTDKLQAQFPCVDTWPHKLPWVGCWFLPKLSLQLEPRTDFPRGFSCPTDTLYSHSRTNKGSVFKLMDGIYIKPKGASNLYNFIVLPNIPKPAQSSRDYWRRQTHSTAP